MSMKKRIAAVTVAATMIFSTSASVFAAEYGTNAGTAISVALDGEELSFQNATPILVDGTAFIPFTEVATAMGANVTYEASTKTVSAEKDGTVSQFTVGGKTLFILKNGVTETFALDTPSFVKNGHTYVASSVLSKAFNCSIGWDEDTETVVILDIDKLMSQYEGKFTILDKYLAYSSSFSDGTYSMDGNYRIDMTAGSGVEAIPIKAKGNITGKMNATKANMNMTLDLDASSLLALAPEGTDPEEIKEVEDMLEMFKNASMDIRFNMDSGIYYVKSALFDTAGLPKDTWIEYDYNEILAMSGLDNMSFGDLMTISYANSFTDAAGSLLKLFPITSEEDIQVIQYMMDQIENLLGDSAFTKTKEGYQASKTIKDGSTSMDFVMNLYTNTNDEVTSYDMAMDMADSSGIKMNITCSMSESNNEKMHMFIGMDEFFSMTMDANLSMREAKGNVMGIPESGSNIVSFFDMMGV